MGFSFFVWEGRDSFRHSTATDLNQLHFLGIVIAEAYFCFGAYYKGVFVILSIQVNISILGRGLVITTSCLSFSFPCLLVVYLCRFFPFYSLLLIESMR